MTRTRALLARLRGSRGGLLTEADALEQSRRWWRRARGEDESGRGLGRGRLAARLVAATLGLVGAGVLLGSLRGGAASAAPDTARRDVMCVASGRVFEGFRISAGDTIPLVNPATGEPSLYPVVWCRCDGRDRRAGARTPVIDHAWLGLDGPTACPACGRVLERGP